MSHEQAMEEVARNCGVQFDPVVVAAFESLMTVRPELRARPHTLRETFLHDAMDEHDTHAA
jgi:HD-GYP domain-containing protein (c-di-GMP phosphodiesterase class II)